MQALVFYVAYLALEFPHGYGMQRYPTAKYLGVMVVLWGIIVTVTAACHSYAGLITTRVLLGCFEAAVAPSLMLITTMWYKKNEQPPRTGIWYLGTGTGTIIGSLLSYAFQHVHSTSLYSWQILFLVVGLLTICIGITVVMVFPDNPMTSRLSHQEKIWAVERLRENQTGIENKHFKSNQVAECFCDPQTWLLSLITISSSVPNGAVSSFQATLIKGFGYNSKETALLQIPGGVCSVISILIATYLAGKYDQRGLNVVTLLMPGILGGALMAFLPESNKAGKLIGNYLTNCIGASLPLMYSWVGANYAGHTKKVSCPSAYFTLLASTNSTQGHHERYPPDILLSRQHHRTLDFPRRRCTRIRPCKDHHHRHLCYCCSLDPDAQILLPMGEQEKRQSSK
jgi:MFS family permease